MKNPIDLAAQAAAFADKYNMLPQGSTVLCALSGAQQVIALLSVLEALANRSLTLPRRPLQPSAAGRSPQQDEDFVVSGAKRGILVVGRGDVARRPRKEQNQRGGETARAMRYGFLTATAQRLQAPTKIATAHNADDNAETLLLHLAREHRIGWTDRIPRYGHFDPSPAGHPRIDIARLSGPGRNSPCGGQLNKTPSMPATVCGRR